MAEALSVLVGKEQYRNFSVPVVSRLTKSWEKQCRAWRQRPLHNEKHVYLWADGIYSRVRGESGMLTC